MGERSVCNGMYSLVVASGVDIIDDFFCRSNMRWRACVILVKTTQIAMGEIV